MFKSLLNRTRAVAATGLLVAAQIIQIASPLMPIAKAANTYPAALPSGAVSEVQVCHANNNDKTPYGPILVSVSAADPTAGHGGHTGPIWNPDLKAPGGGNTAWGDIIPPFDYVSSDGTIQHFSGLNWNPDSQLIWQYGCDPYNIPPAAVAPAITVSPIACTAGTDSVDTFTVAIVNTNDPFNETVTYTVSIKDSTGAIVATQTLTLQDEWIPSATDPTVYVHGSSYMGTLSFTGLPAGTYTVEITGNETLPNRTYQTNVTQTVILNQCRELTTVTPVAPVLAANPCGTASDSFTWTPITGVEYYYTDIDGTIKTLSAPTGTTVEPVHYSGGNSLTIYARVTVPALYKLTEGALTEWTLVFTNAPCPAVIPTAPAVLETCGPNNDTVAPAAFDRLTVDRVEVSGWSNNTYTVTYYAKADYSFGTNADGTPIITKVYTLTDKVIACPAPVFTQADCAGRTATVKLEAVAEGYYYTVSVDGGTPTVYTPLVDQTLSFTVLPKSVVVSLYQGVPAGVIASTLISTSSATFIIPDCPIGLPDTPDTTDPCGAANIAWLKPEDVSDSSWTDANGYRWVINADNSLTVTAPANYYFEMVDGDAVQNHTFAAPVDSNVLCAPVGKPLVMVYCGTINNDSPVLPDVTDNAHYTWSTDYNDATNTITVTAVPDEGYSFEEDTQVEWKFVDEHTVCPSPAFSPTDCIHATGSVTVTYDEDHYFYTVSGPGLDGEVALDSGVAINLAQAGPYTVTAYMYEGEEYVEVGSWTHTYALLNCNPGKGAVPPVVPIPLPIELPHTGPTEAVSAKSLLLVLVATIATYGAVYFTQPRKQLD